MASQNKLIQAVENPCKIIKHLGGKGHFKWIPDELYLKICYRAVFGKCLNLNNPRTFNEKLQWLKLYDRNPAYTIMADKAEVKKYVAEKIGQEYIIPTIGVWDRFEDIDFKKLPDKFVLKCTHDSGGLIICKNKTKLDLDAAKEKIEKCLKRDFFYVGREWAYKNVKPRIIAETLMEEDAAGELLDYKMMCFNGRVKCSFVCSQRHTANGVRVNFYDTDWKEMPFERHYPRSKKIIDRPVSYDSMIQLAQKLSVEIPFVRVDFYEIKGKPYFGELTFYPGNGFEEFVPDQYDLILGEWIKLPGGVIVDTNYARLFIHPEGRKQVTYNQEGLTDYKFYCFHGEPKFMYISYNMTDHVRSQLAFYSLEGEKLPFERADYKSIVELPFFPIHFDQMIKIAKRLSENIPFVRVDLYEINGKIYFSELTFYPCDGYMLFRPEKYDDIIGEMLHLERMRENVVKE